MLCPLTLSCLLQQIDKSKVGVFTENASNCLAFFGNNKNMYIATLNTWFEGNKAGAQQKAAADIREHIIKWMSQEKDLPVDHDDLTTMVMTMMTPYFDARDEQHVQVRQLFPSLTLCETKGCRCAVGLTHCGVRFAQKCTTAKSLAKNTATELGAEMVLEACASAVQAGRLSGATTSNLAIAQDIVQSIEWGRMYLVWLKQQKNTAGKRDQAFPKFLDYANAKLRTKVQDSYIRSKCSVRAPPCTSTLSATKGACTRPTSHKPHTPTSLVRRMASTP